MQILDDFRKSVGVDTSPDDVSELEELVDQSEPASTDKTRRSFIWLQALAFLLGLGLLIYVINLVGLQPLFDALLRIGFGFFVVVAISGLRHVFRTIAMSAAVPAEHRRFTFLQAFAARLGGEAISFLTFTGPLLGEATKVALLRKRVPLTYGVPALVVDNLLYNLSVVFFILSGACVMLFTYTLPAPVYYSLITIATVAALGILAAAPRSPPAHHAGYLAAGSDGPAATQSQSHSQTPPAHQSHRIEGLRFLQTSSRCFLRHDCL